MHRLFVIAALALMCLLNAVLFVPGFGDLLGPGGASHAGQHFSSLDHRIHDLMFGLLFATAAVGLLAQLVWPSGNVAGQLMALIPWVALALVVPLTSYWNAPGAGFVMVATALFGVLTLNAAIFHPTGRDLFSSFHAARVNRPMLALVTVAAGPLLVNAAASIGAQRTVADHHAALGHYGFVIAFAFTVIGVGMLASLRPDGWWLAAWVAGLLPILLGLASLVYPDADSSLGPVWAFAAILWGAAFLVSGRRDGQVRWS